MATLYRQYRPQRFGEVSGQEHITGTLARAVEQGRLAHAYLFHGPRGTGKTTTARIFAKRLNCAQPEGVEPCGQCASCEAAQAGRSLDIIEIDAASNRGIDDIRALQEGIGLAPGMGKYKVYIVDEVHMLSGPAFTALLKTLEEPVKHAIFILATTEFHKVPDTILSRCQVFRFRRATPEQMRTRLEYLLSQEKREASAEAIEAVIGRSDGCYRDAESLLGQVLAVYDGRVEAQHLSDFLGLPPKAVLDRFLGSLVNGESAPALGAVDEAFSQGFDPEQLLHESILAARETLLALIKEDPGLPFEFGRLPGARQKLPGIMRALIQAVQDLTYVPQPMVAVQLAIVAVCTTKGEIAPATPQQEVKPEPAATPPAPLPANPAPPTPSQAITYTETSASQSDGPAEAGMVAVGEVKKVWPKLIEEVRKTNPVGSTFLRAMEPVATSGSTVKVQAMYALHFNFINRAENKQTVEEALGSLLGLKLTVLCSLAEPSSRNEPAPGQVTSAESDLLATVKEAFG